MFGWRHWFKDMGLTWSTGIWGVIFVLISFLIGNAAVIFVIVKLPSTYFVDPAPALFAADRHPALSWVLLVVKNLLGFVAVLLGVVMSLPGVPGPGLLTILIGVMLLNFPGKRRLERKLVQVPSVLRGINWLRSRFGKPPMIVL
jgi:hypothetical protein